MIPSKFFQYIYHIGCAFNPHSIINSGLIPGGQNSSKRQTVFFLLVDPMDKSHKDPDESDLNEPRRAQYLHNAWKRHQDAVYWVDIKLVIEKGLTFYQTGSNAIILQEKHFQLIVFQKLLDWKLEKSYMRNHTCRLNLRQRSHWSTNGKENLVRKLLDNQKGKLLDNQKEKLLDKQIFPTNPTNSKSNSWKIGATW